MPRFCIIPARALGDKRLRSGDILVLNALGYYSNNEWYCWPHHAEIASRIRMHVDSVRKATYRLASFGYIRIYTRQNENKGQTSNVYQILFDSNAPELTDIEKRINRSASPGRGDPPLCDSMPIPPGSEEPRAINIDTLTSHITTKKDISPKNAKRTTYPEEFERFWIVWPVPRRCEKPYAYAAWKDACRQITPDQLLEAVKRYLQTKEAIDGFAPYPAKWLKRQRWLEFEEVSEAAKAMPTLVEPGGDTPANRGFLAVLQKLRETHGDAMSRSWFNQLRLAHKNCSVLTLHAPTRFVAEWVKSNFSDDLKAAVASVWPEINEVRIECGKDGDGQL